MSQFVEPLGECGDGGGLEESRGAGSRLQKASRSRGDHLGGQERVAAQLEEVVVDSDPLSLEDLLPRLCDEGLRRGPWRVVRFTRYDDSADSGAGRALRSTLPLGVSGKASRRTKAEGIIELGERVLEPATELGRVVWRRGVVVGDEIGDQLSIPCASGRATATAAWTWGWALRASSTSPSSMR